VLRTLVFRDDDDEFILRAQDLIDADAVQIHGPLSDELRGRLREREVRVIKALSIASDEFYEFNDATWTPCWSTARPPEVERATRGRRCPNDPLAYP